MLTLVLRFFSPAATPFDVVRARLQAQGTGADARHQQIAPFRGSIDAVRKIVRHEGLSALWTGLRPTLAMTVPATAV